MPEFDRLFTSNQLPEFAVSYERENIQLQTMGSGYVQTIPTAIKGVKISCAKGITYSMEHTLMFKDQNIQDVAAIMKRVFIQQLKIENTRFETLEGIPSCAKLVLTQNQRLSNLHDVHKHLQHFKGNTLFFNEQYIDNSILGLVKVNCFAIDWTLTTLLHSTSFHEALNILVKHLATHDVMECQEDLIQAGLKRYAKL